MHQHESQWNAVHGDPERVRRDPIGSRLSLLVECSELARINNCPDKTINLHEPKRRPLRPARRADARSRTFSHGGRSCVHGPVPCGGAGTLLPFTKAKTTAAGASPFAGEHCRL